MADSNNRNYRDEEEENENDALSGSEGTDIIEQRNRRKKMQRYVFLAGVAFLCLAFLLLLITGVCAIADGCSARGTEQESDIAPTDKLKWTSITVTDEDVKRGTLVLADSTHPYSLDDDDESLAKIYDVCYSHTSPRPYQFAGMSQYMNAEALNALDAMLNQLAISTGNTDVTVRLAFITSEEKTNTTISGSTRDNALDYYTGLGCDLVLPNGAKIRNNEAISTWLDANAARFGFVVRYPAEKSGITGVADYTFYFRYVGAAHATYMKANNLCLEEYLDVLKSYTSKDPLKIEGEDGVTYEVYCCTVSGSTNISVPSNYVYTVSGTNNNSVVVTVNRSKLAEETAETDTGDTLTESNTAVEPATEADGPLPQG